MVVGGTFHRGRRRRTSHLKKLIQQKENMYLFLCPEEKAEKLLAAHTDLPGAMFL